MLRIVPITLLTLALAASPGLASSRGGAAHMPPSGPIGGSSTGMGSGYRTDAVGKTVRPPVPMKHRMTLNLGCYQARYAQLRAAGQDAGLASAGAALICG
ncbi:MAG TPA: hypothetical protein VFB45_01270 [Pseudolabrys sp.]|nr:hypothetical protein [Pseudolabrys sp.]